MKRFFLILCFLVSCRSVPQKTQTLIIQKDTIIKTPSVRIDTVLRTYTDTLRKRNILVIYDVDTVQKRVHLSVNAEPDSLQIPVYRASYIEQYRQKPEPEQVKKTSLWKVALFSGLISASLISLFLMLKKLLVRALLL